MAPHEKDSGLRLPVGLTGGLLPPASSPQLPGKGPRMEKALAADLAPAIGGVQQKPDEYQTVTRQVMVQVGVPHVHPCRVQAC